MLTSGLLVENHEEMRAALRDWLQRLLAPLTLHEAHDMAEALRRAAEAPLDFALVNVELPGPNGIETTRELRRRHPRCPVVVMSVQDSEALRLADEEQHLAIPERVGAGRRRRVHDDLRRERVADICHTP